MPRRRPASGKGCCVSTVELAGINKSFDATRVLEEVSFRAESGEFLALLGPSGCGKSTCLRLLAGLEAPQAGEIRIDGVRVNAVPPAERGIAMVFQSYALFPHLSVRENIVFGLRVRSVARGERGDRLARAAELLGLSDHLDRKPAQLSGGQRQRVALGRALVSGASVVLMDEPLSNLDAKLRQQMRLELRELQRRLDLTVVYVTHDQVEAMTMADTVVVMRDGRIDQIAPPRRLYDCPARVEVARFIGAPPMVMMAAEAAEGRLRIEGTHAELSLAGAERAPRRVLLGIRPEDVAPSADGRMLALTGRAGAVENLGADLLVKLETGASEPLVARFHGRTQVVTGAAMTAGLPLDCLHLFDAQTGARLEGVTLGLAEEQPAIAARS